MLVMFTFPRHAPSHLSVLLPCSSSSQGSSCLLHPTSRLPPLASHLDVLLCRTSSSHVPPSPPLATRFPLLPPAPTSRLLSPASHLNVLHGLRLQVDLEEGAAAQGLVLGVLDDVEAAVSSGGPDVPAGEGVMRGVGASGGWRELESMASRRTEGLISDCRYSDDRRVSQQYGTHCLSSLCLEMTSTQSATR